MKIKFPTGTTEENNQLLLPEGMLSIDMEKKALRLHDGVTQGGFEVVGTQALKLGFQGEVSSDGFITGDALASEIGLTAGTAQYSDAGWLHFVDPVDGLTKYIAKRPFRHTVSWDHINAVGAVDGSHTVVINGNQYRVRLLKGSATDPYVGDTGYDTAGTWGSEWNRLIYPLIPNPSDIPSNPSGEGIQYGSWADYTEADLGLTTGDGRCSWCQESGTSTMRIVRGYFGVSYLVMYTSSAPSPYFGWRPVLELVQN